MFGVLKVQQGPCRLCGDVGPLCKSHVVPQCCYWNHAGTSKEAIVKMVPVSGGPVTEEKLQSGYWEYLLCRRCENNLSAHENAFISFWRKNIVRKSPFAIEQYIPLQDAPYHHLKLFVLSVFWKASISQFFGQNMKLGPYADKLRVILHKDQAVQEHEFPIMARLLLDDGGNPFMGGAILPEPRRIDGCHTYMMCFAGCEWTLFMTDHWVSQALDPLTHVLGTNGSFHLVTAHFLDNHAYRFAQKILQTPTRRRKPADKARRAGR